MSNGVPNFPTPPTKILQSLSMPNDLVANKRNYYTEIFFTDFRSAAYGDNNALNVRLGSGNQSAAASAAAGAVTGGVLGARLGGVGGGLVGAIGGALFGQLASTGGVQRAAVSSMKLPLPNKINDMQTLSWQPTSIMGTILSGAQSIASLFPGASQALSAATGVGKIATGLAGKSLNPLLFMAFNQQNFREFTFEWVLAPKNKQESDTILTIVNAFKGASLPSFGFPFQDYPLIAKVYMYPSNLNGHAIFKPMAIEAVAANYTANPNPSFFKDSGAPTIVTLTVKFKEIKLWYRDPAGLPY